MVWKNPFLAKNSEQQMREEQFLALFDCTALQMVEQQNLEKVSHVLSTPGAGKTSLFRAFSPEVLGRVITSEDRPEHKEFYHHMERLGVIRAGKVFLASAIISCARGYTIIDEMFQNGRKKQIFFALLNYRIAIALLRSIGLLLNINTEEYARITFRQIPQEMACEANYFESGSDLYRWACNGEMQLCKYLDSERNEPLDISLVHTTLLLLKLFEPENILVDGEMRFSNILIIFDDFHKLSGNQRENVLEALYTLKTNTGTWLGQRFEGLESEQLISMDGSVNRDYNPNIIIDNYWPNKSVTFYSMLERIADKRVKEAGLERYAKFSDCIVGDLEIQRYAKPIKECIAYIKKQFDANSEVQYCYHDIFAHLNSDHGMNLMEQAIWYECMVIRENRKRFGQLSLFVDEGLSLDEFKEFVKENRGAAEFYISQKYHIPFYYGLDNLKVLSSYNVEQFLFFAGAYFECCRVKTLEKSSRNRKRLTTIEQENALKKAIKQKWDDMDFRYENIKDIKIFLNSIAGICAESRDEERNSYAGGAYTGVGVKKDRIKACISRPEYAFLKEILGACLSSKYLERRVINNGEIEVFYLNRWLCLYYGLPLAYGGWRRCSVEMLAGLCKSTDNISDENQMILDLFEV